MHAWTLLLELAHMEDSVDIRTRSRWLYAERISISWDVEGLRSTIYCIQLLGIGKRALNSTKNAEQWM